MSESAKIDGVDGNPKPGNPITRFLGSLAFALTVVLLLALACIAGTLIPQGTQVEGYLAQPGGHPVLGLLSALGLTRVFYSWWFVGLLLALSASLVVCTGRRYQAIKRVHGAARFRVVGSFITHISLLLILAGGVVRVIWGQKGMIEFHEGQVVSQAETPEGPMRLPFSLRLVKFELEFHKSPGASGDQLGVQWAAKNWETRFPIELNVEHAVVPDGTPANIPPPYKITVLRYEPDVVVDGASGEVKSRSPVPNNPAVQVRVVGAAGTHTQWVFARFPDFGSHGGDSTAMPLKFNFQTAASAGMGMRGAAIKAFKSKVEVIENGTVVETRVIAVNSPFSRSGYSFYQTSYNPEDLAWSALQVVCDPGVPIVYAGFILMMAGLTLVFCVGPWVGEQRRAEGGLS